MKTILDVMYPEKQQKPVQAGVRALSHSESGHAIPFLHRTSVVHVNLFIAATTHGPRRPGSASHHCILEADNLLSSFNFTAGEKFCLRRNHTASLTYPPCRWYLDEILDLKVNAEMNNGFGLYWEEMNILYM